MPGIATTTGELSSVVQTLNSSAAATAAVESPRIIDLSDEVQESMINLSIEPEADHAREGTARRVRRTSVSSREAARFDGEERYTCSFDCVWRQTEA